LTLDPGLVQGTVVRLEVTGAAFEGKAVARLHGFVVFVEGAVPGDIVNAKVIRRKKQFAEARVVEILQHSPQRVPPRCKHFGVCGGCKWQHVNYSTQLQWKQQHVVESFQHIGGFGELNVLPIIGADEVYFYRNKMEFSFSDRQWTIDAPDALPQSAVSNPHSAIFLGLHVPQRFDKVLDLEECLLQSELSTNILRFTRDFARRKELPVYSSKTDTGYLRFLVIRQSRRTNETMVNIVTFEDRPDVVRKYADELSTALPGITTIVNTINNRKAQIASGEKENVVTGKGVIHEILGGRTFSISAGSFFQTNTAQAEKLYSVAKDFAAFKKGDTVFDFYCGTGTIALFMAENVSHVVGIESVESALRDAERNARLNGVENCSFVLGDLKEKLTKETEWMQSYKKPDVLIIDPPRSGMHPDVVDEIVKLGVPRIVYISCNPATQARDAKMLCSSRYSLRKLQPVDMFPHTYHIENVALFEAK
jgi:23S rRNA (uracil1939-C5)-methyltransferase